MDDKDFDRTRTRVPATLGRRDLFRLGAGVVATTLTADRVIAQRGGGRGGASQLPVPPPGSAPPDEWRPHTGPGY
ncbi:MAG: hypothetical protein ACRD2I_01045, partial [Vicinamibacterales bacterium]